jgi:hypothetical protein
MSDSPGPVRNVAPTEEELIAVATHGIAGLIAHVETALDSKLRGRLDPSVSISVGLNPEFPEEVEVLVSSGGAAGVMWALSDAGYPNRARFIGEAPVEVPDPRSVSILVRPRGSDTEVPDQSNTAPVAQARTEQVELGVDVASLNRAFGWQPGAAIRPYRDETSPEKVGAGLVEYWMSLAGQREQWRPPANCVGCSWFPFVGKFDMQDECPVHGAESGPLAGGPEWPPGYPLHEMPAQRAFDLVERVMGVAGMFHGGFNAQRREELAMCTTTDRDSLMLRATVTKLITLGLIDVAPGATFENWFRADLEPRHAAAIDALLASAIARKTSFDEQARKGN